MMLKKIKRKITKSISKFILFLTGWSLEVEGFKPRRSVIAVFPHTSYWDGVWGVLAMLALNINYVTLSAEWLFFFPMKFIMEHLLHAVPVKKGKIASIRTAINLFKDNRLVNLIVCPEGQLNATDEWNMGFYYIAKKAGVDIYFAVFDYENKKIRITKAISTEENLSEDEVKYRIIHTSMFYRASAKHKSKYIFPKIT